MTAREEGESVPGFLRRLRAARGLSQAEAGTLIGISREEWNALENGRRGIGPLNATRIAEAFKVEAAEVLSPTRDEAETLLERLAELVAKGTEVADRLDRAQRLLDEQAKRPDDESVAPHRQ